MAFLSRIITRLLCEQFPLLPVSKGSDTISEQRCDREGRTREEEEKRKRMMVLAGDAAAEQQQCCDVLLCGSSFLSCSSISSAAASEDEEPGRRGTGRAVSERPSG